MFSKVPPFISSYNFGRTIGKGSFSVVKVARDTETGIDYAAKIISLESMKDVKNIERFQQEVKIILRMEHPGVIKLINFLRDDNYFYLIMELCNGSDLSKIVRERGPFPEATAKNIFKQIVETISYIHLKGIAHRDIKLENVLLDNNNNIKLIDFGFSRFGNPGQMFQTPCGSPAYAAPEVLTNSKYDGQLADMWSLGVLLYGIMTGVLPWQSNNQVAVFNQIIDAQFTIPDTVPEECADLIRSLVDDKPDNRLRPGQVLMHPWLYGVTVSWNKSSASLKPGITESEVFRRMEHAESPIMRSPRSLLLQMGARKKSMGFQNRISSSFGSSSPQFSKDGLKLSPALLGIKRTTMSFNVNPK